MRRVLAGECLTFRSTRVWWRSAISGGLTLGSTSAVIILVVGVTTPNRSLAYLVPFVLTAGVFGLALGVIAAATATYGLRISDEGFTVLAWPRDFVPWDDVVEVKGSQIRFTPNGKLVRVFLRSNVQVGASYPQAADCLAVVNHFAAKAGPTESGRTLRP